MTTTSNQKQDKPKCHDSHECVMTARGSHDTPKVARLLQSLGAHLWPFDPPGSMRGSPTWGPSGAPFGKIGIGLDLVPSGTKSSTIWENCEDVHFSTKKNNLGLLTGELAAAAAAAAAAALYPLCPKMCRKCPEMFGNAREWSEMFGNP